MTHVSCCSQQLVDPSYIMWLSFLFCVHQRKIAADACIPGSTFPDKGQQQPETTPPTLVTWAQPKAALDCRKRIEWALDGTDTFSFTYHSLHTVMLTMYCHFLFCFRKKHLAPGRCIFLIHNFQESSSFWKQKESSTLKPTISAPASFCSWPPGNSPDQ